MTLNLGPAATVEKATVAGSDNKVNGTGDLLDCTIPEGSYASVEVMGAFVVGNNTYQPLVTEPYEFPTPEVVVPGVEVVSNVALTAMQPEAVTVAGNKATITDTYKTAFYTVPQELQDNLKAVKVTASSDGQFCIKVLDDQGNILNDLSGYGGDMPNYGVSAMTQYTASYPVSAKVVQIDFMSLGDLPLEVVVEKLEFVLNSGSDNSGTQEEIKEFYIAQDVALNTAVSAYNADTWTNAAIPMGDFASLLPDALKSNSELCTALSTAAGVKSAVKEFVFTITLTQAKAAESTGEDGKYWAPQINMVLQNENYSKGTYGCYKNGGEPGAATFPITATLSTEEIGDDWNGLSQLYLDFSNADTSVQVQGTYSCKVVLK